MQLSWWQFLSSHHWIVWARPDQIPETASSVMETVTIIQDYFSSLHYHIGDADVMFYLEVI